jgi:hypothetical protein
VGQSALLGAGFGAPGYLLEGANIEVFSGAEDSALAGNANYLLNSAFQGAFMGAAYGAVTGRDLGSSALVGAEAGIAGAAFNSAVGHIVGIAATHDLPEWVDGAYFYQNSWPGVTLGNVVVGNSDLFYPAQIGMDESGNPKYAEYTGYEHETLQHIPQSVATGFGYFPVQGLSMIIGSIRGGQFFTSDAIHTYGPTEHDWGNYPNY